jgi:3-oxoacyl-[acyl-carrier protein] reductase
MQAQGIALVPGASRSPGRAVALELAHRGFEVVASMRDPAAGESLCGELAPFGIRVLEILPGPLSPAAGIAGH